MCMIVGLCALSQCINHFRRCGFFCFKHYFGQVDDLFFVSFITVEEHETEHTQGFIAVWRMRKNSLDCACEVLLIYIFEEDKHS